MSRHSDEIHFRDMLDHAREALSMIRGKKRSDLDSERMLDIIVDDLPPLIAGLEKILHSKKNEN
jgi:hypothetical protein